MSICWYCHWGWHPQVEEIYRRGYELIGGEMSRGPGHIVWGDENFDTETILGEIARAPNHADYVSAEDISVIVQSLNELLAVPEEVRCCEPEDYDGEHPDMYPPPWGNFRRPHP